MALRLKNNIGFEHHQKASARPVMQSTQDSPQQACSSTQKQARYCCRCCNHGVLSEFKGHRQQCPYKECPCDECTLVTERRRIIAKQTALKRRQQEKARKVEAVLATSSSDSCLMIDESKGSNPGGKKKKKKCSNDLDGLYCHSPVAPSMEPPAALLNCPSLSSSFSSTASSSSCFSPCPSNASSPAMEIVTSPAMEIVNSPAMEIVDSPAMDIVNSPAEFASNDDHGVDVIKFEQVIFKPIEEPEAFSQESSYTAPPMYAPIPITSNLPLSPTIDKTKLAYVGDLRLPSHSTSDIAHDIPIIPSSSVGSYSCGNSSISTPTAPSFSTAPGVISSSNINLAKTYPYDNNYGTRPSSVPSAVTGYGMVSTQPNLKESCSKMNLLMRVFPEHKPNMIQAVLDSCGGDPIRCIEMILNLQDAEKKPNMTPPVKCEPDVKPIMSPGFGTPLASPVYIQQSPHPSLHPADVQHHHPTGVLASSSLSSRGIPSVVTTYHQSGIQSAPSLVATMNQTPGPAHSYPEHHHISNSSVGQHHGQGEYAQGTTPGTTPVHQHHVVDDTPTLPGPVTTWTGGMGQFGGTTPSRITVNTIPSTFVTGSVLCPHQAPPPPPPSPATPSSLQLHGIPIRQLPATPNGQLHGTLTGTQDGATSYRFHSSPSVSSSSLPTNIHLTPSHTQVYCQTIGSIQPGKCLSYTSLQAAAISLNPATSTPGAPIIVPVMRENCFDVNQNHAADHGEIGSAFSRWHEPSSQSLSQVTTGGTNLTPFLVANQMVANQENNLAVEAVHALVSLRATSPRKQQMNESNGINDLLLEEE